MEYYIRLTCRYLYALVYVFFFSSRRRHTRYWRDWSSDVCSSDLVALGVEGDGADRGPVAGRPAPAARIGFAGLLVQRMAGGEDGTVPAGMALRRGDVADAAVPVLVVVPVHERGRPLPRLGQVGKARGGEVGGGIGGAGQRPRGGGVGGG